MPRRTPSPSVAESSMSSMSSMWTFIRAFMRDRQRIGTVAATSTSAARHMARLGDVAHSRRVVEFGPGTGAITKRILEALPADGRLWAYEVHEPFVDHLRASFADPRLTVLAESAEHIRDLRRVEAPDGFDAIICSIPFSLLPPPVTSGILAAAADSLRPGGKLVALQYHPTYLRPIMREHFREVHGVWHLRNIPPTLLLTGLNPGSTN